jgi:hypothetical protein
LLPLSGIRTALNGSHCPLDRPTAFFHRGHEEHDEHQGSTQGSFCSRYLISLYESLPVSGIRAELNGSHCLLDAPTALFHRGHEEHDEHQGSAQRLLGSLPGETRISVRLFDLRQGQP